MTPDFQDDPTAEIIKNYDLHFPRTIQLPKPKPKPENSSYFPRDVWYIILMHMVKNDLKYRYIEIGNVYYKGYKGIIRISNILSVRFASKTLYKFTTDFSKKLNLHFCYNKLRNTVHPFIRNPWDGNHNAKNAIKFVPRTIRNVTIKKNVPNKVISTTPIVSESNHQKEIKCFAGLPIVKKYRRIGNRKSNNKKRTKWWKNDRRLDYAF